MAHILILAALPEEADALFSGEGECVGGPFAERRLAIARHDLVIATCGLGKVNAALCAGMLAADADLLLMSGTCGSLGAGPGAYWIAEALQHDYGANQPGLFRRYRAGEWPIGEAGEAHFPAMADPGLGLPHARIASGDSFVACPDAAADLADDDARHPDLLAVLVDAQMIVRNVEHDVRRTEIARHPAPALHGGEHRIHALLPARAVERVDRHGGELAVDLQAA